MSGSGLYEISGLAWSGSGKIIAVEVSADGGQSWARAALSEPVLSKAMTRFRMAWRWNGGDAVIKSRAIDESGAIQPSRDQLLEEKGTKFNYHYNGIQSWRVASDGEVVNVYG